MYLYQYKHPYVSCTILLPFYIHMTYTCPLIFYLVSFIFPISHILTYHVHSHAITFLDTLIFTHTCQVACQVSLSCTSIIFLGISIYTFNPMLRIIHIHLSIHIHSHSNTSHILLYIHEYTYIYACHIIIIYRSLIIHIMYLNTYICISHTVHIQLSFLYVSLFSFLLYICLVMHTHLMYVSHTHILIMHYKHRCPFMHCIHTHSNHA